jgi:ABC-type uncharacterized transport system ATPase subunit
MDENAQRCIVVPFFITDKDKLQIASATEKFDLNIDVNDKVYSLFMRSVKEMKFTIISLLYRQKKLLMLSFC